METTTRMGSRSSSRHGPAVQFSGRVRKWQKTWAKSDTSDQLQMFKWLPVSGDREEEPEELPPRKYRFLPFDIVHAEAQAEKEPSPAVEVPGAVSELDTEILNADPATAAVDVDRAEGLGSEKAGLANEAEAAENSARDERPEDANQESAQLATEQESGVDTGLLWASSRDQEDEGSVKDPAGEGEQAAGALCNEGEVQIREALESLGEEKRPLETEPETGSDSAVEPPVRSTAGGDTGGRSTAGEIAESLVATGLVEEGDAAKVEARALANVVSESGNMDAAERLDIGGQKEADPKGGETVAAIDMGEGNNREKGADES